MTALVLTTLAAGGEPAIRLANIIQALVVEAGRLGELEIAYRVEGTGRVMTEDEAAAIDAPTTDRLVRIKRFPPRWLTRIGDAINRGLLWSRSDTGIVRIMLMGPR
ncbi:hypothetical protein [Bradyrhizobium sp. Bra78]|uniref:hypothetical protein n=1 Tax=Bradyrhizobium sp. Bra78 TaxID=2926010 RepID=UPI0021C8A198|nr:hypothetical protein [Bradyrhizobium sp. Bra78]